MDWRIVGSWSLVRPFRSQLEPRFLTKRIQILVDCCVFEYDVHMADCIESAVVSLKVHIEYSEKL